MGVLLTAFAALGAPIAEPVVVSPAYVQGALTGELRCTALFSSVAATCLFVITQHAVRAELPLYISVLCCVWPAAFAGVAIAQEGSDVSPVKPRLVQPAQSVHPSPVQTSPVQSCPA